MAATSTTSTTSRSRQFPRGPGSLIFSAGRPPTTGPVPAFLSEFELILGIDPGKSGGLAVIWPCGAEVHKMPDTERDLWDCIRELVPNGGRAYIEKVHAMPGQGVTSMFSFGQNYGMLRAFLVAHGIPFETVTPAKWQREFALPSLKAAGSPSAKKNAHKARAQELFPSLRITHAVADALLIAEWGRRLVR